MTNKEKVLKYFATPKLVDGSLHWHQGDKTLGQAFYNVEVVANGDVLIFSKIERNGQLSTEDQIKIRGNDVLLYFNDDGQVVEVSLNIELDEK